MYEGDSFSELLPHLQILRLTFVVDFYFQHYNSPHFWWHICYNVLFLNVIDGCVYGGKTTIMGWWYCEEAPIADDCDQGNHLDGSGGPISMRLNKVTKSRRCPYASVAVRGQNCNTGIIYKRGQVGLQDGG